MTKTLTTLFAAYGRAQRATAEAIVALKAALPKNREKGRALLLPVVAAAYHVPLVTSTSKSNAGALVLDSTSENYDACRKALGRCIGDVYGFTPKTGNKAEPTKRYRAPNGMREKMLPLIEQFGADELIAFLKHHVK